MAKLTKKQVEQVALMFATLSQIGKDYQTPKQLRKDSEKDWGCDYEDALEMSYENIQESAKRAIKGMNIKKIIETIQQ